ncbi:hypothetical protein [Oenococcus kitaharae]|uniref:Uncharacterized protein n=1 Tax=Oenococcus kitaharae DSM 17330 TaxID=1045004 RepID=G9WIX5_9LACO|nr:hypothetical protein [Oenococcus kitaharae]EHN58424.1 hypothetical protein OKIT_0300 [Oenococcus kitaharae DSM 17330]MCV3296337.1 hypothetical protein [Oenococcus kitaharae]OEY81415.1 hypothetical protein NT95_07845 [Oenococcus kitaharae]OEY82903.1 hypothetical protein NV75_05945 [Oenococcus kitaharae]OEY84553.1 hypothetical protein NT96_04690 [Oenococcus kitaharae]
MIKNPRFLFSTLLMILFLVICYVFGISWSAITYRDWLTSEAGGIYFYRLNWQTVFSVIFLIYWSINIAVPVQTVVRLQKSSLLSRMYMIKTLKLTFVFALIYWLLPWTRIFQFNPSSAELVTFLVLWTLQVALSLGWTLIIISLVQIVMNYTSWSSILIGLIINTVMAVIAYLPLPLLNNSIFSQTQVTLFAAPHALGAGISYATFGLFIYIVILFCLYIFFQNSIRRREWIK